MDDESLTRFKAEMRRLKEMGGPGAYLRRAVVNSVAGLFFATLWFAALVALTRYFPRDANGAMGLGGISLICGLNLLLAALLWRWRAKGWRLSLWSVLLAGTPALLLVAYLIDRLR